MDESTSLLFGLEEFRVVDVQRVDAGSVRLVIETVGREAACPDCGLVSSRVKDRPVSRVKELPASGQRVELWWRKSRLLCPAQQCPRVSFVERTAAVPPRSRLTVRLRDRLATAVARSNRSVADVASEYDVSWRTAHRALVAAAAAWLPEPQPTTVLGIDETRAGTVRWILQEAGWRRSDPWMTSFVDADPTRPGQLLGLSPGRSGVCVADWLAAQTAQFRAAVEVVVIDPSAPYAAGIRDALPHARIAVDHWHLVRLGSDMVTDVRQRATREQHGRRGTTDDPVWAHRRMLLTAGDRLSTAARPAAPGVRHRRPDQRDRRRVGLQGAAPPAAHLPQQAGSARTALAVLRRLREGEHARDHQARHHHRDLVVAHRRVPRPRRHQSGVFTAGWVIVLLWVGA